MSKQEKQSINLASRGSKLPEDSKISKEIKSMAITALILSPNKKTIK